MKNISLCVDPFLHRAKEGDREGYIEREGKRERDREWDPHNLEGEASSDHPIGEESC